MSDFATLGFRVNTDQLRRGSDELDRFGRSGQQAGRATEKASSSMDKLRGVARSLVPVLSAATAAAAARSVINATIEQERAITQLESALRSTGQYTPQLSREMQQYAAELQDVSTFGNETIIASQALLVTFREIGQDVAPRAQQAILDMSTALGRDLNSSTMQVGRALNDPIRGMSALARSGVQLTEAQQDTVRAMVELGDVAGAQSVILGELETQFGGSAAAARDTLGGSLQALKNAFGDLLEGDVEGQGIKGATAGINEFTRFLESPETQQAFGVAVEGLLTVVGGAARLTVKIVELEQQFRDFARGIPGVSMAVSGLSSVLGFVGDATGIWVSETERIGNELTRTVERSELMGKSAKEANEASAKSAEHAARMQEELSDAYATAREEADKKLERLERIIDRLRPQEAAVRELAEEWMFLRDTLRDVDGANQLLSEWWEKEMPKPVAQTNALTDALENSNAVLSEMQEQTESVGSAVEETAEKSSDWEAAYNRGIERMRDATGEFFRDLIRDGELSFSTLGSMFSNVISEMAAQVATPILTDFLSGEGFTAPNEQQIAALSRGAGLFAANQMFSGTTGLGASLGGLGGQAFGGSIAALGKAGGPLGAIIGSIAGGALESFLGGSPGEDPGRGIVDFGTGTSDVFGVGQTFDPQSVDAVRGIADFAQAVAQVVGTTESALDIVVGRTELRVNEFRFAADQQDALLRRVFDIVVERSSDLDSELRQLIIGFNGSAEQAARFADEIVAAGGTLDATAIQLISSFRGTAEQTIEYAGAIRSLAVALNTDPVQDARAQYEAAGRTLTQSLDLQNDRLRDLIRTYDGSLEATQALSAELGNSRTMAFELAQQLLAASQQIDALTQSSAQSIRQSIMSEEELREARLSERDALVEELARINDPAEIRESVSRLDQLNRDIFNALGPEEQRRQAEAYASFIEMVNDLAQDRLQEGVSALERTNNEINAALGTTLDNAAAAQLTAAHSMQNAADAMNRAALNIPSTFTVATSISVGGSDNVTQGLQSFARGGITSSGMAIVGEEGPELVHFQNPSFVYDADRTRRMLGGGSDGQELDNLRREVQSLAMMQNKQLRLWQRVTRDGESLRTTPA